MHSSHAKLPRYATIQKKVGETPLVATEQLRTKLHIPKDVPLAYAGRLDPMASGTLLILIGDECKKQKNYHAFDKEYVVEMLIGVGSDTGDVLGLLTESTQATVDACGIRMVLESLLGKIALPYPHFSSKTVAGKPLHTWTLEGKINEIVIPVKESRIFKLAFNSLQTITKETIVKNVREKIETIPEVTAHSKKLGEDFRREKVRASWDIFLKTGTPTYKILTFTCTASSGTYMRSLVEKIASELGTKGLAYSIHRTKIGTYRALTKNFGFWSKTF
jgi:tRNA pseudouridine(55) synthase